MILPIGSKQKFTALEFGAGFLKLAQAQGSGRERKLLKLIVKKLPSSSEQALLAALRDISGQLKGKAKGKSRLGHLAICLPRHKVTVRLSRFPTINEQEIAGMVQLQSIKELPFAKDELISDYLITGRTKQGYTKVALIIVHQDVVNGYLDILRQAGLEAQRVTFSAEAILDWYSIALGPQPSRQGCAILVDLDTDNTDIAIFTDGHLDFTRGLAWGSNQLGGQTDIKSKLVQELRRTFDAYGRQEKVRKVERILLGPVAETESLKTVLEQEFSLPCEVISPLKGVSCGKEVSLERLESQASLLRVLGMVLEVKRKRLNLLPVNLRRSQVHKLRKQQLVATALLVTGIILLSAGIFAHQIYQKQMRIFYLDREIKKTAPLAQKVEQMLKKIELIERRRNSVGAIGILAELYKVSSQNIALSNLSFQAQEGLVKLQGVCTNMPEIFDFINTLEKATYFKNVQLKYVSEKKGFTDFKIECSIEER